MSPKVMIPTAMPARAVTVFSSLALIAFTVTVKAIRAREEGQSGKGAEWQRGTRANG